MKINFIGLEPVDITEDQAQKIKGALVSGAAYVSIGNEMYKSSIITGITDDRGHTREIAMWGTYVPSKRLPEPKGDGHGRERYLAMRRKIGI